MSEVAVTFFFLIILFSILVSLFFSSFFFLICYLLCYAQWSFRFVSFPCFFHSRSHYESYLAFPAATTATVQCQQPSKHTNERTNIQTYKRTIHQRSGRRNTSSNVTYLLSISVIIRIFINLV